MGGVDGLIGAFHLVSAQLAPRDSQDWAEGVNGPLQAPPDPLTLSGCPLPRSSYISHISTPSRSNNKVPGGREEAALPHTKLPACGALLPFHQVQGETQVWVSLLPPAPKSASPRPPQITASDISLSRPSTSSTPNLPNSPFGSLPTGHAAPGPARKAISAHPQRHGPFPAIPANPQRHTDVGQPVTQLNDEAWASRYHEIQFARTGADSAPPLPHLGTVTAPTLLRPSRKRPGLSVPFLSSTLQIPLGSQGAKAPRRAPLGDDKREGGRSCHRSGQFPSAQVTFHFLVTEELFLWLTQ